MSYFRNAPLPREALGIDYDLKLGPRGVHEPFWGKNRRGRRAQHIESA